MPDSIAIPARFRREVEQHLVLNAAELTAWPLVLGIFGRPGDGKSHQVRTILRESGVDLTSVNAADLESDRAGQPGKLILSAYENAGHRASEGTPAALLVDDFDTTVGEWQQSTTTVNHQQVLAQLMHLADTPTEAAGKRLRRVPVFVTGNDLSKVYPPLRRPGRMRTFPWLPTDAERQEVVEAILTDLLDAKQVKQLLAALPEAPIAFFSDLRVDVLAGSVAPLIQKHAGKLKEIVRNPASVRAELEKAAKHKHDGKQILDLASQVWDARQTALQSHLGV